MAPQEAIEEHASTRSPAPTEETVATASLTPLPQRSTVESNAIDNHLAALIVGGKSDRVVADPFVGPRNDEAIAEAVGPTALRAAAVAGNAKAQFVVATRYLEGKAVPQDAAAAARWYQKAAAQGLAAAQYRLGTLFERGLGVPADKVAARMWYERAAEAGNVKAMHNLAVVLADKDTGAADYARAARWFGAAADHGVKDSQFNLAVLYERGLGVIASRPMAYRWYLLAARQGDGDAEARAKTLHPYLDAAEVKTIEAEIAGWMPREAKADANVVAIEEVSWNAAAEEPARTLPPSPELTGSKLISRTQELLAGLGYDIGTADGVMGARTTNAIRRFQSQNGLTVDGMPSNRLLRHLMAKAG
jgi:localization factor PodJL